MTEGLKGQPNNINGKEQLPEAGGQPEQMVSYGGVRESLSEFIRSRLAPGRSQRARSIRTIFTNTNTGKEVKK